jgi:hypothetical protein
VVFPTYTLAPTRCSVEAREVPVTVFFTFVSLAAFVVGYLVRNRNKDIVKVVKKKVH